MVQAKLAPGKVGVKFEISSDVVLKKINETQKDSAENEYRIASRVARNGGDRSVPKSCDAIALLATSFPDASRYFMPCLIDNVCVSMLPTMTMPLTSRYCIPYLDRICEESGDLWLVLKRVKPSSYGIDLVCRRSFLATYH